MILDLVIANPAGNITGFVLNQDISKRDYVKISEKIMSLEDLNVEQVGFINTCPKTKTLRMDMMGGEFCGNATRSFGLYLAKKHFVCNKQSVCNKQDVCCKGFLDVAVSGISEGLVVEYDLKNNYCRTSMPLPTAIDQISIDGVEFPVVVFEGIVHAIAVDITVNRELFNKIKTALVAKYNPDAVGVMFLDNEKLFINPVVFVKETNTTVDEGSCGSGSVATAIYLAQNKPDGTYKMELAQPGGTIEVVVEMQNNKFMSATMGGEVEIFEPIKISI